MIIFLLVNKDLGVEDKELGKENAINVGGGEMVNNEPASKCFRVNPEDGTTLVPVTWTGQQATTPVTRNLLSI